MEILFDNRQKLPYPEDLEELLQSAVELCLEEEQITKKLKSAFLLLTMMRSEA